MSLLPPEELEAIRKRRNMVHSWDCRSVQMGDLCDCDKPGQDFKDLFQHIDALTERLEALTNGVILKPNVSTTAKGFCSIPGCDVEGNHIHVTGSTAMVASEYLRQQQLATITAERGRLRAEHHELCDSLDCGLDGIAKPCNCWPNRITRLEAENAALKQQLALHGVKTE